MADITTRAPQIRASVTVNDETNFAEALALLFEDSSITDQTATAGTNSPLGRRLENIFSHSGDIFSDGISHFSGIFRDWKDRRGWGDTGFKQRFQDHVPWPGSSMQVCHFLTAVDMGYRPHKLYMLVQKYYNMVPNVDIVTGLPRQPAPTPDPAQPIRSGWWTPEELECVTLIIAHEKTPDSGTYGQEPDFWNKVATFFADVTPHDIDIFHSAFDGMGAGPLHDADKAQGTLSAIAIGTGSGNSMQDLLLSLFGFKFGAMIKKGEMTSTADGGNWVRVNLKDFGMGDFDIPNLPAVAV